MIIPTKPLFVRLDMFTSIAVNPLTNYMKIPK